MEQFFYCCSSSVSHQKVLNIVGNPWLIMLKSSTRHCLSTNKEILVIMNHFRIYLLVFYSQSHHSFLKEKDFLAN